MKILFTTALFALSACLTLGSTAALANHGRGDSDPTQLLSGIASTFPVADVTRESGQDRHRHSRHDRGFGDSVERDFNHGRSNSGYDNRGRNSNRHGFGPSYTSEPIRGGSSRRTRIIENPYPGRAITGISFTGIDHDVVHINDVITYPRKRKISHHGYSLSLYHPSPLLSARGYVDFISVKAKRREYFTVTFHYD